MKAAVLLLCLAAIANTAMCQVIPKWPIPAYFRRPLPPCTLETPIGQLEFCVDVDGIGVEILLRLNNENFPGEAGLPPCTYDTLIGDLDKCYDINGIGWEMMDKAGIIPEVP